MAGLEHIPLTEQDEIDSRVSEQHVLGSDDGEEDDDLDLELEEDPRLGSESSATRNDGDRDPAPSNDEHEALLGAGRTPRAPLKPPSAGWWDGWVTIAGVRIPRLLLVLISLPVLILLIASLLPRRLSPLINPIPPILLSNGTHPWHPLTLIISLDGFRPSYLSTHPTLLPSLLSLATSDLGLRATAMQPVFPTLTFPNHWALMSGLYPESSGIVANDFWTEDRGEFKYTDPEKSWDPGWWFGEPMWSVVHRAGRKAANIMWPGPPVTSMGIAPDYFVPYRSATPSEKLGILESYLDYDLDSRPSFISLYVPDVDQSGHAGGPVSPEVDDALSRVDSFIGGVLDAVKARNATGLVDIIVVSDHGMASTSNIRLIYLDDILGKDGYESIEHKDGWPSVGLRFKPGTDVNLQLNRLLDAADKSNGTFAVYTHDTMPERWHFSHSDRIAGIYVVPDLGWAITDHASIHLSCSCQDPEQEEREDQGPNHLNYLQHEHEVIHEGDYRPKGNHGYDNEYDEMQAIFFAHGPFASALKASAPTKRGWESNNPHVLERFRNLEIYGLVMKLQGLESISPPHNGTQGFWEQYLD